MELQDEKEKTGKGLEKYPVEAMALPPNSPFSDWKEARRFAGSLPFTFSYNPTTRNVLIIEGVRQNWTPQAVEVKEYQVSFLKKTGLENAVLANAFIIENIPYWWKKGKTDHWAKQDGQ